MVSAIILAAGAGARMGSDVPKQFLEFGGKPVLRHTLDRFQESSAIDDLIVVMAQVHAPIYLEIIRREWRIGKLSLVVAGGAERHHSVLAGLAAVADAEIIMIHDGVRPFVSERILRESVHAARIHGGAVVGLPPTDTVKLTAGSKVIRTLDRRLLIQAQTPQTFRADVIRNAYRRADEQGVFSTDDAALVEGADGTVVVVEGDRRNLKITTPEDMIVAEAFWKDEHAHRPRI